MAPITQPLQEIEVDLPDTDMYEEKFREQERRKRKHAHLIVFYSTGPGTHNLTACGLFFPYLGVQVGPTADKCPECLEYEQAHP